MSLQGGMSEVVVSASLLMAVFVALMLSFRAALCLVVVTSFCLEKKCRFSCRLDDKTAAAKIAMNTRL
jgi:hypothetical protein